jgi:hypothetical protein
MRAASHHRANHKVTLEDIELPENHPWATKAPVSARLPVVKHDMLVVHCDVWPQRNRHAPPLPTLLQAAAAQQDGERVRARVLRRPGGEVVHSGMPPPAAEPQPDNARRAAASPEPRTHVSSTDAANAPISR